MSETEPDTNDADSDEEVEIAELRQELAEIQAMVADLLNSESGKAAAQPQTNAETCECGQSHANYSAVPGQMERDLGRDRDRNREDAEAYPAGGRKAWERRQVGLDDVPDDSDDYPAGGRSNWENRKQRARTNVEQSAAETPMSAAARRSVSARQNRMEPSDWVTSRVPDDGDTSCQGARREATTTGETGRAIEVELRTVHGPVATGRSWRFTVGGYSPSACRSSLPFSVS